MIQASELRIGNLLYWGDKGISPIQAGGILLLSQNKLHIKPQPIPLTEEILLKCGFKKHITSDIYPTYAFKFMNVNNGVLYVLKIGFLNHIKHIHQLQNLYFALTGEELGVNL